MKICKQLLLEKLWLGAHICTMQRELEKKKYKDEERAETL